MLFSIRTIIGTWNVQSLYQTGYLAQLTWTFDDILGYTKIHWTGTRCVVRSYMLGTTQSTYEVLELSCLSQASTQSMPTSPSTTSEADIVQMWDRIIICSLLNACSNSRTLHLRSIVCGHSTSLRLWIQPLLDTSNLNFGSNLNYCQEDDETTIKEGWLRFQHTVVKKWPSPNRHTDRLDELMLEYIIGPGELEMGCYC